MAGSVERGRRLKQQFVSIVLVKIACNVMKILLFARNVRKDTFLAVMADVWIATIKTSSSA